jgi:hypothetical protein
MMNRYWIGTDEGGEHVGSFQTGKIASLGSHFGEHIGYNSSFINLLR